MSNVQLSIPVAMLVENALTSGEPTEAIIACMRSGDFSPLMGKVKEPAMDFAERLRTAEEIGDDWEKALREGYEFKFLHINGLKRLLAFRFGKEAGRDYIQEDLSLRRLQLGPRDAETLRALIGRQWRVFEEEAFGEVGIELKYK
jgi:hypothetical protein